MSLSFLRTCGRYLRHHFNFSLSLCIFQQVFKFEKTAILCSIHNKQNLLKLSVSDFPTLQGVKIEAIAMTQWTKPGAHHSWLNKHVHRKAMLTTGVQSSVWEFLQIINTSDFIILLLLLLLLLFYYYYYHYFILSVNTCQKHASLTDVDRLP